jgi:hypothetical protein
MGALIKLLVLTYMFIPTCMNATGSGREPIFASAMCAKIFFYKPWDVSYAWKGNTELLTECFLKYKKRKLYY